MERIRLRECPFCGCQARLDKAIHPASGSEYVTVGCTNEDCVVHIGRLLLFEKGGEELAAARWNIRHRYVKNCQKKKSKKKRLIRPEWFLRDVRKDVLFAKVTAKPAYADPMYISFVFG